ncbi:DUF1080 domain-containing protein [Fontisphaera persica]|uniref:family 16 glycoside hydrolase n=1 Tax=Fontisphaera persica TaxID=2974023 RepID=UPI0024BF9345|nr:family 16 glycoside hydrolase [Fontisphaera persica]WCJ59002.1 DUF1080 domain-containing protein [Fontisphaera persica]
MKGGFLLFALACALVAARLSAAEDFQTNPTNQPPRGWEVTITGAGQPVWTVQEESSAAATNRVLVQSGITPRPSFPLCVRQEPVLRDGWVSVRFKTVSGELDQAAGVVWRYQSATNYYICRANAREDNVVLYKVQQGKRTALPLVGRKDGYGVEQKVTPGQWHTLRVEFRGPRSTVFFDGQKLLEVEDETFTQAGRIGLWTKADSVTMFDDFDWGAAP